MSPTMTLLPNSGGRDDGASVAHWRLLQYAGKVASEIEEGPMSHQFQPVNAIPAETARVAHAICPRGTLAMRLRDQFYSLYTDHDFADLFPTRGQPAACPWRLAVVTVLQFLEGLTDRQAAEAVGMRIDVK